MKLGLFLFLQRHLEQFWMNEQSHLRCEINQDNCCQPSAEHTALGALGPGPGWCQGWQWSSISGKLRRGCGGIKKNELPSWNHPEAFVIHTHSHIHREAFPLVPGNRMDGSGPLSGLPSHGYLDEKEGRGEGRRDTEVGLPQSPLLLECFREWELSGSQVFWEVRKVRRSW